MSLSHAEQRIRVYLLVGINSSRANTPFLSTNLALAWVRAGPGSVQPACGDGKHQENFFTLDLDLYEKKTELNSALSLPSELN